MNIPFHGSYRAEQVTFLLKPIQLAPIADTAVKEALIQSGQKHYSEMLSPEYPPSARYLELFRLPDEEGEVPKPGELVSERLAGAGMSILGSIDDVKRGVEKTLNEFPAEYLVWHLAWRPMPAEEAIRQLELFATHIMPEFGLEFAGEQAH